MKNRRQKCDPTTTNSMNRRHRKEFSCTRYINVAAIIPGWKWHPTLKCVFFISFFGFLSVSRVQRKPLRLSLSSNLPYENITGESKFDNSVCETTVSQHMPVFFFDCVCCIVLEHKALCPSSIFPHVPHWFSLPMHIITGPSVWNQVFQLVVKSHFSDCHPNGFF